MRTHLRSIRALGFLFFLQVLIVGFAKTNKTVVKGVNDPTRDVNAVQDAVDRGGLFPRLGFIVTNLRRAAEKVVKFYISRPTRR
ncbi:MAG: hypothetical protein IBX69_15255, partial [Anaerolineales bacterium]|nr:hypothetical protein [Anaerolineales bacterium]